MILLVKNKKNKKSTHIIDHILDWNTQRDIFSRTTNEEKKVEFRQLVV